jgi:hypothetical protein
MVSSAAGFATPQAARGGRGTPATPVAPAKFVALLPTIPGWTKGQPDSEVINIGMVMSTARVSYEQGDLSLSMEIIDTLANPMLMGSFMSMMMGAGQTQVKTETGWARGITIAGFPGAEVWDNETKTADVLVVLNGRFVVKAGVSGMKDTTVARQAVEAVDLKALAALK